MQTLTCIIGLRRSETSAEWKPKNSAAPHIGRISQSGRSGRPPPLSWSSSCKNKLRAASSPRGHGLVSIITVWTTVSQSHHLQSEEVCVDWR